MRQKPLVSALNLPQASLPLWHGLKNPSASSALNSMKSAGGYRHRDCERTRPKEPFGLRRDDASDFGCNWKFACPPRGYGKPHDARLDVDSSGIEAIGRPCGTI